MNGTGTGAGRLNYEMPVIAVMPGHKEYGTFGDLQKTLSQLGFESGSASLRLTFKNSGTPLEDAMTQISQYFKNSDPAPSGAHSESSAQAGTIPDPDKAAPEAATTVAGETIRPGEPDPLPMEVDQDPMDAEPSISTVDGPAQVPSSTPSAPLSPPPESAPAIQQPSSSTLPRNIQVFSAPTSSTPQAARHTFNEADYQPSVDQLRGLQASYKDRSKNTRLLSDKELDEQEAERQEKLAATATKGGIVRVRLPDGAFVQFSVSATDTTTAVYTFVTTCLAHPTEPFHLSYRDTKGQFVQIERGSRLLFHDLKFSSNELLTFRWDDRASAAVRGVKPVLSSEWQQKAAPLTVEEPVVNEPVQAVDKGKGQVLGEGKQKKEYSAAEKENKLKSLLGKSIFKKK
jgi:tether containing UBX domain for GLUT4